MRFNMFKIGLHKLRRDCQKKMEHCLHLCI
jgi:hypothetical protein